MTDLPDDGWMDRLVYDDNPGPAAAPDDAGTHCHLCGLPIRLITVTESPSATDTDYWVHRAGGFYCGTAARMLRKGHG